MPEFLFFYRWHGSSALRSTTPRVEKPVVKVIRQKRRGLFTAGTWARIGAEAALTRSLGTVHKRLSAVAPRSYTCLQRALPGVMPSPSDLDAALDPGRILRENGL